MKKFLLNIFLFISVLIYAQNVEKTIIVKDAATNLPIEDAIIMIMKTKQMILTNKEGKGSFILKNPSNINVSHASFNRINIRSSVLIENETVLLLKNNLNDLDELIITKQPQKHQNEDSSMHTRPGGLSLSLHRS